MFDDWLDILLNGTFGFNLPDLTLTQGNLGQFRGSGQLNWESGEQVRIHGETDGGERLLSHLDQANLVRGQLIPHATYLSLSGRTQDGWDVTTTPLPMNGYHLHVGSPRVLWDFPTSSLTLTRSRTSESQLRIIRAILGPSPRHWIRMTGTEIQNPYFGYSFGQSDWLLAKTAFGIVAARARSSQWFEVRIEFETQPSRSETFQILTAIGRAFGFVLGRRIFLRGYQEHTNNQETQYLDASRQHVTQNSLVGPIGEGLAYLTNVEILIGQAINFFLTDDGERVAHHLSLCWDTVDNFLPTQLAIVSIALEGLLRIASRNSTNGDPGYISEDRTKLQDWLTANTSQLTPRFVKRVQGFLGALDNRRPVDVLHDWRTRSLLGVTQEDIDAWDRTRNPAAHGGLIGPTQNRNQLQTRMNRFHRVVNLMNRIVLQLMGYRGLYVDYAQENWPEVEFPLTDTSIL